MNCNMSKKNKKHSKQKMEAKQNETPEQSQVKVEVDEATAQETTEAGTETTGETPQESNADDKLAALQAALDKQKQDYLLLMADFDNFRKRTIKEKSDLIKNGAERAMLDLLPVVDDLERAIDAMGKAQDVDSLKEGVELIYNKFLKYLESQHIKPIESTGKEFDTDLHEAVTLFPAPTPDMKGKVVDTTVKGYMLNDKVLRHAKVVIGQ